MNSRQRKELQLLIEHGSFGLNEFADLFSLSKRQIRYDIDELNTALESTQYCLPSCWHYESKPHTIRVS